MLIKRMMLILDTGRDDVSTFRSGWRSCSLYIEQIFFDAVHKIFPPEESMMLKELTQEALQIRNIRLSDGASQNIT